MPTARVSESDGPYRAKPGGVVVPHRSGTRPNGNGGGFWSMCILGMFPSAVMMVFGLTILLICSNNSDTASSTRISSTMLAPENVVHSAVDTVTLIHNHPNKAARAKAGHSMNQHPNLRKLYTNQVHC
jgi:hypothetical protein